MEEPAADVATLGRGPLGDRLDREGRVGADLDAIFLAASPQRTGGNEESPHQSVVRSIAITHEASPPGAKRTPVAALGIVAAVILAGSAVGVLVSRRPPPADMPPRALTASAPQPAASPSGRDGARRQRESPETPTSADGTLGQATSVDPPVSAPVPAPTSLSPTRPSVSVEALDIAPPSSGSLTPRPRTDVASAEAPPPAAAPNRLASLDGYQNPRATNRRPAQTRASLGDSCAVLAPSARAQCLAPEIAVAERRLRNAYRTALDAGVRSSVLNDYRREWSDLRGRAGSEPYVVLDTFGAMTDELNGYASAASAG